MYSLKLNKENFNKKIKFEIRDEFFETYTFDRFENAKLQISLFLDRKGVSSNYLLKFKLEGILILRILSLLFSKLIISATL